jgi:hypothetical protein
MERFIKKVKQAGPFHAQEKDKPNHLCLMIIVKKLVGSTDYNF